METTAFAAVRDAIQAETPVATARVVVGADLGNELTLSYPDRTLGTLGSPTADEGALRLMRLMLRDGGTALEEIDGRRVFIEAHLPPPHLIIIGAVHIAIPLVTFG